MTVMIPTAESLPQHIQDVLMKVVKPKFDAYFALTAGGTTRAVPAPNGEPWFIYPNQTMIPDLVFLWSLFSDANQAVGGPVSFAAFLRADAELLSDVRGIVEGAPQQLGAGQVPTQ